MLHWPGTCLSLGGKGGSGQLLADSLHWIRPACQPHPCFKDLDSLANLDFRTDT